MRGREEPLDAFLTSVQSVSKEIPDLKVNFYGGFPGDLRSRYIDLFENNIVNNYPLIPNREIQKKINESFACLIFNAGAFTYGRSSKIYEYATLRRPILSIDYGGEIERLINEHRLGKSVNGMILMPLIKRYVRCMKSGKMIQQIRLSQKESKNRLKKVKIIP